MKMIKRYLTKGLVGAARSVVDVTEPMTESDRHLVVRMPIANQGISVHVIERVVELTTKYKDYCFISFDPKYITCGIGLELTAGCIWSDLSEAIRRDTVSDS